MISGQSPAKQGMVAGGIAIFCALLTMRVLSEWLLPFSSMMRVLVDASARQLSRTSEFFWEFIYNGNPVARVTVIVVVVLLVLGSLIGAWAAAGPGQTSPRAVTGAAVLFGLTTLLIFAAKGTTYTYLRSEILLTLALSYLVFALVLTWLLKPAESNGKWQLGGLLSVISVAMIIGEILVTE